MIDKFSELKNNFWFAWYFIILYYLILRAIFGPKNFIIYSLIIFMLVIRLSFEKMALIFLLISIISYILFTVTEANNYMSFVFVFLILYIFEFFYYLLKEKS